MPKKIDLCKMTDVVFASKKRYLNDSDYRKKSKKSIPEKVGKLEDGSVVETQDQIWERQKQVYIAFQKGEMREDIARRFCVDVVRVDADIAHVDEELNSIKEYFATGDDSEFKIQQLMRLEHLYVEGMKILDECKTNKSKLDTLRFLRGVATDQRGFMMEVGMIFRSEMANVDEVKIKGIPLSKMPTQALMEEANSEVKRILSKWVKDPGMKELLDKVTLDFDGVENR